MPVLTPDQGSVGPTVGGIIKYDGHLVIEGTFYVGDEFPNMAYLDGNTWHTLGPGLEAGFSSVRCMTIYQGDNPGRDIMRWDGTQFHRLGDVGLQRNLGDDSWFSTVGGMVEHDGLLYVGGGFRFAAGIPAKGMATWDGTEWCSVPGNLSDGEGHNGVWGAAFLQDTLFVICGYMADGDSVNLAAKFIGESYAGPCSSTALAEDPGRSTAPTIFTGAEGTLPIHGLSAGNHALVVHDALGRIVFQQRFASTGASTVLPLPDLSFGAYVVRMDGVPSGVPLILR